jgi:hypothetical protein
MSARRARWLLLATIAAAPATVFAVGEQNGRLLGYITEQQSGAPVPGASITVNGPSLIGGARSVTSFDDGSYEISDLPPGRYDVQVTYSGVKPVLRRAVIRLAEATRLDIAWSPELAEAEVTVVVEERHLTRPEDMQTGTVLSQDQESKVATGRTIQDVVQQVAGLRNVNDTVRGNPEIKGGTYIDNRFLVDGLDITDPVTQSISSQVNFESIGSLQVLTGGMEAQYNALGGVINVITNAGSDELHVDTGLFINNQAFSTGGTYGAYQYNGVAAFDTSSVPNQGYEAYVNMSGPLVKHKLWGSLGLQYTYRETTQPASAPLFVTPPSKVENRGVIRLKLTWAPSENHRLTISLNGDPTFIENSEQQLGLADTSSSRKQGSVFGVIQYDYFKGEKLHFNLQAGYQYREIYFGPQGKLYSINYENDPRWSKLNYNYDYNRPLHNNTDDGTAWYNGTELSDDQRHTMQFDPSVALRGKWAGYHDAKIGIQSRFVWNPYTIETPGGYYYNDAGGGPGEAGLCNETTGNGCFQKVISPPSATRTWGVNAGLFIQDRWKVHKRITIMPGIRVDWGMTQNTRDQTISNLVAAGPRLGATFDITGDGKTVFTASYGRSNEILPILEAGYADVFGVQKTYRWDPTSNMFVFQSSSGGDVGYRTDPNVVAPHTDEVTLSLRRELYNNSMGGIDYTYKKISNIWDRVEINQIWDPSGTRVVGYVDGQAHNISKFTTPDDNYRIYQGIDFYVEARPTPGWDIYAAYTLSWLYGPGAEQIGQISGYNQFTPNYNPRQARFYDGFLPEDLRHQLKVRVSYTWKGLSAGVFLNYNSGAPLSKRFFQQQDGDYINLRSPQGTDPGPPGSNDPTKIAEFRTPDVLQTNLRVSWDMHPIIKQHVILLLDFFNLFNLSSAITLENRDVPSYGAVTSRQTPFQFQLGLRYAY